MSDARTIREGDKERAGLLIGMAVQKHKEVIGSNQMKLEAAIECGKHLLEARDIYGRDDNGKRQWGQETKRALESHQRYPDGLPVYGYCEV